MRVSFCGVIEGSVSVRRGETPRQAIDRATGELNLTLERYAKRFTRIEDNTVGHVGGPVVGLEPCDEEG